MSFAFPFSKTATNLAQVRQYYIESAYVKIITNTAWVSARLCKLQKRCTRLAAASDQVYQLLVHGQWFSPGTPASSTTKTGRHDIAEMPCTSNSHRNESE
jgi:hypothetical protein